MNTAANLTTSSWLKPSTRSDSLRPNSEFVYLRSPRMTRPAISRTDVDDYAVMSEASELCPLFGDKMQLRRLHIGMNRIYVDDLRSTIVRVHHDDFGRDQIDTNLRLVNRLRDHDAPVVTPFARRCVELPGSRCWATYWPCYDDIEQLESRAFGRFVAIWHRQAVSAGVEDDLPGFMDAAIARVEDRCSAAEHNGVPTGIVDPLRDQMHRLCSTGEDHRFVLHGDVHRHNIVTAGSQWLFVDMDGMSVGALEHDLAPVAMACLRYHVTDIKLTRFLKGHQDHEAPFSPRLLTDAIKVREVLTSLAGLDLWDQPEVQDEMRHRVKTMGDEPSSSVRWRPLIRRTVT